MYLQEERHTVNDEQYKSLGKSIESLNIDVGELDNLKPGDILVRDEGNKHAMVYICKVDDLFVTFVVTKLLKLRFIRFVQFLNI